MSLIPRGVTRWTREAVRRIVRDCAAEGEPIRNVWGFAPWPDHWNRRCADLMVASGGRGRWISRYLLRWVPQLRIKLVIWDRRIWRDYPKGRLPARTWQDYAGKNPHTDHLHVEFWE